MPYAQAKDGNGLYYYDWGTGPVVVLIHGWPLTSAMWEYQADALAHSGFRVIAYDRRGFGRSEWTWGGYDYDTLADDLDAVLREAKVDNASLVGFSMGGGEVARYLGRHGAAKVNRAVLISAVTPCLLNTERNPEGVDRKVFDDMIAGLKKDRFAFLQSFAEKFYGRSLMHHTVSEAFLQFTAAMSMTASPHATIELVRAFSETDFRNDLLNTQVRTLVIHGTKDETVPIEVSGRRSAQMIPHAELIEYDGEPHGLFATVPDRLTKDLLSFLHS